MSEQMSRTSGKAIRFTCILLLLGMVVLITFSQSAFAAKSKQTTVSLKVEVNKIKETKNVAFFTKVGKSKYSFASLDKDGMKKGDHSYTIDGIKKKKGIQPFYVMFTDKNADELKELQDIPGTEKKDNEGNPTGAVSLSLVGEKTLSLQTVRAVYNVRTNKAAAYVNVTYQLLNDTTPQSKIIQINVDTDGDLSAFTYSIDGGPFQTSPLFTVTQNRVYDIIVKADDASDYPVQVQVAGIEEPDVTAPTYTGIGGNTADWETSKTLTINGGADDRGLAVEPYSIDGVNWQVSPSFQITDNGVYTFHLKDAAGNTSQTESVTVDHIDRLAPGYGIAIIGQEANFSRFKDVSIIAEDAEESAVDGKSGVVSYRINGGNWISYGTLYRAVKWGVYTYETRDRAGNISTQGSFVVDKIDVINPVFSAVSIEKQGGTSDTSVVKNGDSIAVKFKAEDPADPAAPAGITTSSGVDAKTVMVKINNEQFSAEGPDADGYYTCTKTVGTDFTAVENSKITVSIDCADMIGNEADTHTRTTGITYYAPIKIEDLQMLSGNEKGGAVIAKNGDTIDLAFKTTHPVKISGGKIAGQDVKFSSTDGMSHRASYQVKNGQTKDNAYIDLIFYTDDAAGNQQVVSTEEDTVTEKIKYYAPITLYNIVIQTDNRKDKTKYAKDDDTITVTFDSNHMVDLSALTVAGKETNVAKPVKGDGVTVHWKLTYQLKKGDMTDQQIVPFTAKADDIAGNRTASISEKKKGVKNRIRYYAPITSITKIYSSYTNRDYMKNGDLVTVAGVTNHNVHITHAYIEGRAAEHDVNKKKQSIFYEMPKGERHIKEGLIEFNYTVEDVAGNRLRVEETNDKDRSRVIYDRTVPTVTVSPDNYAFTKENITYTFTYEDENLDGKDAAILMKGGGGKESKGNYISADKFSKTITLSTDGDYTLQGDVIDKAGNQFKEKVETKVTVDKVDPMIDTTNVDIYTPKVYRGGFVLNKSFSFIDENIKSVNCIMTDSSGSHDWDVAQPFTTDGKKSVTMIATDMATNTSEPVSYDFYIDGTKPKALVKEAQTGEVLDVGNQTTFTEKVDLQIRLESLNMQGITDPDKWETLQLYDQSGQMVADLLKEQKGKNGMYTASLRTLGTYSLKVQAVDQVGNRTGEINYPITVAEKTMLQKFYENTPLFVITVIFLPVLICGLLLILRKKRRDRARELAQKEKLEQLLHG